MAVRDVSVAELFAGVGGFRLGLEYKGRARKWPRPRAEGFKVIWSNQWEPGEGKQWASKIYTERFGSEGHESGDIHRYTERKSDTYAVPEHDLLVAGFPCQDYSVARTVSGELGIHGEKGRLWRPIWQVIKWIHRNETQERPKIILLENVPRLLNSPAEARGLNFSVILKRLLGMGYEVEWRVIDASEYGMPQQRKRVFILAYRTPGHGEQTKINRTGHFGLNGPNRKMRKPMEWWMFGDPDLEHEKGWGVGPFARAFPAEFESYKRKELKFDNLSSKSSDFGNAGYAWEGTLGAKRWVKQYCSWKAAARYEGKELKLENVLEKRIRAGYEVDTSRLDEWGYAKGSKNEFRLRSEDEDNVDDGLVDLYRDCMSAPFAERKAMWKKNRKKFLPHVGNGKFYHYDEGKMDFDRPDKASRTMVTNEIGRTPSRMRHIIEYEKDRYRRLTPIEAERLNQFPDNWTRIKVGGKEIAASRRGFLMGNALVVGVIDRLRKPLHGLIVTRRD